MHSAVQINRVLFWVIFTHIWLYETYVETWIVQRWNGDYLCMNDETLMYGATLDHLDFFFFFFFWLHANVFLAMSHYWETGFLRNICAEYLPIWFICPIGLEDELIRNFGVKDQDHCDPTRPAFEHNPEVHMLIVTTFHTHESQDKMIKG